MVYRRKQTARVTRLSLTKLAAVRTKWTTHGDTRLTVSNNVYDSEAHVQHVQSITDRRKRAPWRHQSSEQDLHRNSDHSSSTAPHSAAAHPRHLVTHETDISITETAQCRGWPSLLNIMGLLTNYCQRGHLSINSSIYLIQTATTLCLKKRPTYTTCYNFYTYSSIATIFGTNVAENVGDQNILYFPTSPN